MNKIKKILVTGSSGTIGTRLCEKLLEEGYVVVGADRRPNKWVKKINRLTINIDLRNKKDVLRKLPKDVDLVIHLAANARVYNLVLDPSLARDNFETLFNVLEFTRISKIKKFMFASSREVYGNSDKFLHKEDEAYVQNCESPYTATKIGGEALVHSYQQCYGINFVIFRFSNVYGMYDDSDRVVPRFIKSCKKGEILFVYGRQKLLDFTYIDDAVAGIMGCIRVFGKAKNDVYNIADGRGRSVLEVARLVKRMLKADSKIKILPSKTGEVVKYVANISKAKRVFGYRPKVKLVDGLEKSLKWYKM